MCACRRAQAGDAQKRGHTPDPDARALFAAGFVLLLTSLPADEFPPERVCALYRLRWQIELAIKRLKSLLGLGARPAKIPALARVWSGSTPSSFQRCSPRPTQTACVTPFPPPPRRTLSFWRLLQVIRRGLLAALLAPPSLAAWLRNAHDLAWHLTDPPRRRPCQTENPLIMLSWRL
jgi:hypothetical protein